MSQLYGSFFAKLKPTRYAKASDQAPPLERWGVGMACEEMLEDGLSRRVFNTDEEETVTRPGEFETAHTPDCIRPGRLRTKGCGCVCGGGVLFSPDLLIFNGNTRVGEIKLNSMSAKGAPWKLGKTYTGFDSKFDLYFCQMKLYCLHLGTPFARLYMFSAREMVYFNEKDIFRAWDVTFTPRELEEEWELMVRHGVAEGLLKAA